MLNDANVPNAEALYDQLLDPESWQPYPDTRATLEHLKDVPLAVVSNIGWDIRPVFERYGSPTSWTSSCSPTRKA